MSFKPVRLFLTDRLLEVDGDFESHDDAFSDANVGDMDFDKRFHIFYADIQTTAANLHTTQDVVSATVTLFFRSGKDSYELDEAIDMANQYRMNCLRKVKLSGFINIKSCVCNSILAVPLDTNDNAVKVILKFSIGMIFGTNINLDC